MGPGGLDSVFYLPQACGAERPVAIGSGNTFPPPSPNHAGSKLASGSDDKTVKIWSARGEDDILECQATFRGRHACCTASAAARPFSSSATQLQSKSQVPRRRLDVGEHRNNVQALHAGAYIYSENSTIIKLHKTETLNVYAPSLFASYARNLCSAASEHHSLHAPIFVLPL